MTTVTAEPPAGIPSCLMHSASCVRSQITLAVNHDDNGAKTDGGAQSLTQTTSYWPHSFSASSPAEGVISTPQLMKFPFLTFTVMY